MTPEERRARFAAVRLYLVSPLAPRGRTLLDVATHAIAGGVDALQVRDKHATDDALVTALRTLRPLCDATGTLLILNDRPDLAVAGGADGVHVGQGDVSVAQARAIVGDGRLIGLSTHSVEQIDAAARGASAPARDGAAASASEAPTEPGATPPPVDPQAVPDHIGVGPIHATPTKADATPIGTALIGHAAAGPLPFVAIGGIDATTIKAVLAAGAPRVAVVRAIAEADDPQAAARLLRTAVDAR